MGTSRRLASCIASSPHGHQSTGLAACWRRYGDWELASRFIPPSWHVCETDRTVGTEKIDAKPDHL